MKLYNAKFKELFHTDTKEQAVVCYLSLERRFLEVCKEFREYKFAERTEYERENADRWGLKAK